VHAIFGGFAMGIITPRKNRFAIQMTERIEDITLTVLLPLYFTLSGLSTNINSINTPTAGGYLVLVVVTACIAKVGSATLAARFMRNNWRESCTIGVLMNAKGLVELIALNIGLQAKVLSVQIFSIFVVMCIVTTCMTSPLVYLIYIRHKRGEIMPKETHSYLIFGSDLKTTTDAVTCISAFCTTGDTSKVVYLNEISERPSSYFFQFSRKHLMEGVPSLKDKSHNDILSSVKKHGTNQGLVVKTKILTSNEIPLDVVNMVSYHITNLVLFGVNAEIIHQDSPKGEVASPITRTLSTYLSTTLGGYLGWHSVTTKAVLAAKQRTACAMGVYLHRGAGLSTIYKIMFPYTGQHFERAALDLVLARNPAVSVDIYALPDSSLNIEGKDSKEKSENNKLNIHLADDPYAAVTEEAKKSLDGFTLVVVGMDRADSNRDVLALVNNVSCCMMIVYNATVDRSSGRLSDTDSQNGVV